MTRKSRGILLLYNIDLVRSLCRDISAEKDTQKVEALLSLLQAIVKEDQEEIRLRMSFLAKRYPIIHESERTD
jgi:hypothetical protein